VPKTLQEWVETLSVVELPVMQRTLQALQHLEKSGSDIDGSKLAALVLPDPMMVFRAMCMANSGRKSRFAQPVLTIEHAVMMNGMAASFSKLTSAPAIENLAFAEARQGVLALAARASHAAIQCRDWALHRLDTNMEEVYIATLLQELAGMLLWAAAPDVMASVMLQYRTHPREEAECAVLGHTLDELSLALAQALNLPPLIGAALQATECELHVRPRLVASARKLARDVERGWMSGDVESDILMTSEALRMHQDDLAARVHRVAAEAARMRVFEGVSPAARWLPLLPGEWPEEGEDAVAKEVVPQSSGVHYQQAVSMLEAHHEHPLALNELMQVVLRGMRDGIGLKRMVFALLSQDGQQLRARFVVGVDAHAELRHFQFNMTERNLFSVLMTKQQSFWLNQESEAKAKSLLTPDVQRITGSASFFTMSVAVREKVVGLFYADHDGQALSAEGYEQFKRLCALAATRMAHLAKQQ
jgi:HD-like signal output (HDOD) protein